MRHCVAIVYFELFYWCIEDLCTIPRNDNIDRITLDINDMQQTHFMHSWISRYYSRKIWIEIYYSWQIYNSDIWFVYVSIYFRFCPQHIPGLVMSSRLKQHLWPAMRFAADLWMCLLLWTPSRSSWQSATTELTLVWRSWSLWPTLTATCVME